jgi:hypothetical protein
MDELFRELSVLSGCVGIDKHDAPAVQDLDDPGFAKSRYARFTSAQALQEREITQGQLPAVLMQKPGAGPGHC